MPWHKFELGQLVPLEEIVLVCERHIRSGRITSPEEHMRWLEKIRNCGYPELVFSPFGSSWGRSPMNPNAWRTPKGNSIWTPETVPRENRASQRDQGKPSYNLPLPEELPAGQLFSEGTARQIVVNAYEREPSARKLCIEHYGVLCHVCGMSFTEHYGPDAAGIIHVHHIVPLSEIGREYQVDPIKDLRPVCPNCHAVIHARRPARSLEDVKDMHKAASR
jgi:5-methylcytosine-specific restriction endonuclease McrA